MTITNAPTHKKEAVSTAGHMLKAARLERGLSLADIAAVTRIPRNMLEHLERDRFDEYSASVFVRGHLVNYAREVRLDPQVVLRAYEGQSGVPREPNSGSFETVTKPARTRVKRASKNLRRRYPMLSRVPENVRPIHMVTVVLVLCALFASAFFFNGSSATAQNPSSFKETTEEAWDLEKDADQVKWLLEQPASLTNPSE